MSIEFTLKQISTGHELCLMPHDRLNPDFGFKAVLTGPNGRRVGQGESPTEALEDLELQLQTA